MSEDTNNQKVVVVGAGPVGALAALYAAERGDNVEVYELRAGRSAIHYKHSRSCIVLIFSVRYGHYRIRTYYYRSDNSHLFHI